ncbi:pyrroloquinoline quinone biosynthesis protein PqqB [Salinisphaera sp. Q1T1-3]|uniref:pyrroloquinoline quinone biosynthesis protein PqqB n=1 Tax=Salinisphaera sp. Q1T1-3 TaxID=2321229 RepID=UPI000E735183|nr:pyrroloquinoline quinone biosynthesis protein PqqB [Salinisphaera sp. Q1T1-3]RJS91666.1 pyrroloquinoline quinone biosynthesis protein PqqB [Salinisphaera sp. Q1T1-3]
MEIKVLGSAAGGGFPQWNSNVGLNRALHDGQTRASARTQSSIAVRGRGEDWLLINASPDIRQQILATPALRPAPGRRGTGIGAVLLMDSQIDHTAGLTLLREGEKLDVHCTRQVYEDLTTGWPLFNVLSHYCGADWHEIVPGRDISLDVLPGVGLRAVALSSAAPPYSPHRQAPTPGDNIGLVLTDAATGRRVFYAPGLGAIDDVVAAEMAASDVLLVDGTFFTETEMIDQGVGRKTAASMGHLPQSGEQGMLATLARWPDKRRVLIHINNTNPILDPDSEARATVAAAGVEVAHDGMEIVT